MKNLNKPTLLFVVMSLSLAANAFSETPARIINTEKTNDAEALKMTNRLEEIKAMDPSNMTRKEKSELRREVRKINHSLKTQNGGVYLSVGAVIIIVLLLILLL